MSKTTKFPEIRAELRQREAHSKSIHQRIRETSGEERMKLWEEKRSYGLDTRFLLLYYAMLRGMPRQVCEPKYRPRWDFAWGMGHHAKRLGHTYDVDAFAAWLSPKPVAPEEQAAE